MSDTLKVGDVVGPHVTEYGRERLDALPDGAVITDQYACLTKRTVDGRVRWLGSNAVPFRTMSLVGPVKVLSIPEESR